MFDQTQGIPDDYPSPPISGDNLDPQVAQAAGIPDDQAYPPAQSTAGAAQPAEPVPGGAGQPAPGYVNPPEGNAIQAGVQAATTPMGPIPPTGQSQTGAGGAPGVTQEDLSKTDISGSVPPQQRVASMIMGEGAMTPEQTAQVVHAADPGNTQPPGNKNLLALHALVQKGDTKGAVAFMQGQRMLFMPKQAMAYMATEGIQGKPPDINAAIANANEAEQHILDGSNVKFSHGGDGNITATVTAAPGQPARVISLTLPQFQQYLNPKGDGQWDKLMNSTVPATLQAVATRDQSTSDSVNAAYGAPGAKPGETASPERETGGEEDEGPAPSKAVQTGKAQAMDVTQGDQPAQPGQFDKAGHYTGKPVKSFSDQQAEADPQGYGSELEKRSRSIYPDVGHEAERQQWMEAQEEKEAERQNKIGVAAEKGKNETERARIIGGSRVQAADVTGQHREGAAKTFAGARMYSADRAGEAQKAKALAMLDAAAKREAGIQGRSDQRNAASLLRQKLANEAITPLTDEEKKQVAAYTGTAAGAPQAPSGQPAAPPSGKPDIHQQAIAWAQAHPNDPRAAQIMQKNGM
jgi:hypothetical protein